MITFRAAFKERSMKVTITEDCILCGLCEQTCPEVFEMGDQIAKVKLDEIPEEFQEAAQQAADECPTSAIIIEE
jgi:ferredoxin